MLIMDYLLILIIVNALIASFIILLLDKIGVLIWLQMHGSELIAKLARCMFCLSFWVNVLIAVLLLIAWGNFYLLLIPIFSTPLTRKLL